jgi:uncharacterized protein YndB with AHSA1/START domain
MTPEPSEFTPSPLADVRVEAAGDRWSLVLTRDLRHPVDRVFAALTDPTSLAEWAPFVTDRPLDRPGEVTLTMIDGDVREESAATVTRVEPPTLLEYTWGDDLLRWELEPTPAGCRLVLRHTLADRDVVSKVTAGWHLCLDVAERLLDGDPIGPIRGEAARAFGWDDLDAAYAARLDGETDG